MIAIWIFYAVLVGACVGLAAAAVERLLRLWGRPVRVVWAIALLATALVPPLLLLSPLLRPAPAGDVQVTTLGATAIVAEAPDAERTWTERIDAVRAEIAEVAAVASRRLAPLDGALLVGWGLLSAALLAALLGSAVRLQRQQRGWRAETVDGVAVLVAPDVGPAVVGGRSGHVVLPDWALALDAPLRALVLRHETEHLRAGDPRLLLAGVLALVLVPWNLAVWWQVRRLRLAVELDCDRRVLGAGGDVERYGLLLLAVSQRGGGMLRLAMPALCEGTTDLERRIAVMTDRPPRRRLLRTAALLAAAGSVIATACVVPSPNTVAGPETPEARVAAPRLVDANTTFFEFQVEQPVSPANDVSPQYPAELRAQGVSGTVIAQFEVDTLGKPDLGTFKAIESSHELFTVAVRTALPSMRFRPAEVGGRPVRQLVEQTFGFSPDR